MLSGTSTSTSKPGPGRFNKACDSCHVSKVRCIPDPQSPISRTCKRCVKNGTPCVFSPVGPRRRPARTKNDRIAELERRVRDMQLKLERQVEKRAAAADASPPDPNENENGNMSPETPDSPSRTPAEVETETTETETRPLSGSGSGRHSGPTSDSSSNAHAGEVDRERTTRRGHAQESVTSPAAPQPFASSVPPSSSAPEPRPPGTEKRDIIERGLLTSSQADRLIQEFRSNLDGKFLGMALPDGATSERLRREKPAFWLSILCAASTGSAEFLSLAPVLFGEMKRILDGRITSGAAPDLDALQALMNYCTFHYDPVLPLGEHLMGIWGAAMRMVVQMAEASPLGHVLPLPDENGDAVADLAARDDDVVQLARELLHWYWASFSLTVKNRQSTMLRQTHLVESSLRVLQTTQCHHDMCLVQWVRLVRIAAEAVLALHQGHTKETAGLSDEARDEILDVFEKKRKMWLVDCPFDFVNEPLMLEYHYYVLLVSEVIYPAGPADFRRRSYGLPNLSLPPKNSTPLPDQNFFAPYKLRYTRKCITSAHACLDLATRGASPSDGARSGSYRSDTCSTEDLLRRFGVLPCGRIFYALRFLLFVAHEVWRTGRYDVVDVEDLRIEVYLTALKRCLRTASSGGKYRTSSLWLYALETRIEPWYKRLYTLLQRDGPRVPPGEDLEGEETPRPSSSRAVSPNGAETASKSQDGNFTTAKNTLTEVPVSPLLLEFPFELFSASDMFAAPFTNGITNFNWGLSTKPISPNASTLHDETQLATTTRSTQALLKPLREPATGHTYTERPVGTTSAGSHLEANDSVNSNLGDLDTWFENLNMELDPLMFNWDYMNQVMPGSDMFTSSMPPHASAGAPQHLHSEGVGDDDGRGVAAQSDE